MINVYLNGNDIGFCPAWSSMSKLYENIGIIDTVRNSNKTIYFLNSPFLKLYTPKATPI